MNLLRVSVLATVISCAWMTTAQAEQTVTLPTMTLLAENELRQETGVVPYQEDLKARKALQHIVMRSQWDAQNFQVDSNIVSNLEYQPRVEPNMSQLSPFLQAYVTSIANGLKSSDPTNGLYIMLQPLGINRGNINDVRQNGLHIQLGPNFGQGLQNTGNTPLRGN